MLVVRIKLPDAIECPRPNLIEASDDAGAASPIEGPDVAGIGNRAVPIDVLRCQVAFVVESSRILEISRLPGLRGDLHALAIIERNTVGTLQIHGEAYRRFRCQVQCELLAIGGKDWGIAYTSIE